MHVASEIFDPHNLNRSLIIHVALAHSHAVTRHGVLGPQV